MRKAKAFPYLILVMISGLDYLKGKKSGYSIGKKVSDDTLISHIASFSPIVMPDKSAKRLLSGKDVGELFSFY